MDGRSNDSRSKDREKVQKRDSFFSFFSFLSNKHNETIDSNSIRSPSCFDPWRVDRSDPETSFTTWRIRSRSFCKCRRQQARNQLRWTPGSWGREVASRCWRWRVTAVERPAAGRRRAERPVQEARVSEPGLGSEPALARPTRRPTIRRATAALETTLSKLVPLDLSFFLTVISHSPFSTCLFPDSVSPPVRRRWDDYTPIGEETPLI